MKSLTKSLFIFFLSLSAMLLIGAGCSDNSGVYPLVKTELNGSGNDGGNDEIGPQDDTDEEFQTLHFTFDEEFPVATQTVQKTVYAGGGTITVEVDGQNRHFTFPPKLTASAGSHSVTVSKGVNLNGENLEFFSLSPDWVTYTGAVTVELETDVKSVASSQTDPEFTLYRMSGGVYVKYATGKSDSEGSVSFELRNCTDYAVIYKGKLNDNDIPLN